jgi:putative Ca2+/H+ antiporter (TMEM165/GDT1 family)
MDWKLFISTFGVIFLAELGDKTQITVITLSSKTGKPIAIMLGAIAALVIVTAIGALAGGVITRFVPIEWVSKGAAVTLIVVGILMLFGKL